MSADLVALLLGTLLAIIALAFVMHPLFFRFPEHPAPRQSGRHDAEDSAIVALRDIELDRAMGKLSDDDYAELKRSYSAVAIGERRAARGGRRDDGTRDAIEAWITTMRVSHRHCSACGVRPEPDAVYCSSCGALLAPDRQDG